MWLWHCLGLQFSFSGTAAKLSIGMVERGPSIFLVLSWDGQCSGQSQFDSSVCMCEHKIETEKMKQRWGQRERENLQSNQGINALYLTSFRSDWVMSPLLEQSVSREKWWIAWLKLGLYIPGEGKGISTTGLGFSGLTLQVGSPSHKLHGLKNKRQDT